MRSAVILLAVAASAIYVEALKHDRAREADQVVAALQRLAATGWSLGVPASDFPNTNTPAFRTVVSELNAREPRVGKARVAFTLKGHAQQKPEGIAYDGVDDVFYLSSLAGAPILRVTRKGRATAFAKTELPTLGMKVDPKRRLLWAIGTAEETNRSALFAYDLRDGSLVKQIDAAPALLNDLTILDDGTIYATDMGRGNVVRLAGEKLEIVAENFAAPNGITHDGQILYVADFRGVTRLGATREELASSEYIGGIDGLDFVDGALIGIQNAIGNPRVVRLRLDGRVDILESKNPHFALPTTGAIARGAYWFIANSEMRSVKPRDPVMLRIAL